MKKFENIDDDLFAPLVEDEARRATGQDQTGVISVIQTNDPNPDETFDHV